MRLLARLFIKNPKDYEDPGTRRQYGMLLGALGIALNLLLFAAKFFAGLLSKSIAITADAFNNLSDAGSSLVSLLGFKIAGRKADAEHPFGHGLAEHVAGLIISIAIMVTGFELAKTSLKRILSPQPLIFSPLSVGILIASMAIKLYMNAYNRSIGKKIRSATMRAVAADSLSDVFVSFAVLLATLLSHFFSLNIDGWAGALVALVILWAGYSAARDTISPLLGSAPDPTLVANIHKIVGEYAEVVGVHDLIVHTYGAGNRIVSLHADVPADGDFRALHDVIDHIERRLRRELGCHAVIHMDPIETEDSRTGEAKRRVLEAIRVSLGEEIGIHDFRMAAGATHTNVIFDVDVPQNFPMSDEDLRHEIVRIVEALDGDYSVAVTIDKSYIPNP